MGSVDKRGIRKYKREKDIRMADVRELRGRRSGFLLRDCKNFSFFVDTSALVLAMIFFQHNHLGCHVLR